MTSLKLYEAQIDLLIKKSKGKGCARSVDIEADHHLNGGTNSYIQSNLNSEFLKKTGIFFTDKHRGLSLAKKLLSGSKHFTIPVLDPTCGAGDLLLSCARFFPLESTLVDTLALWSKLAHGYDIHSDFVNIAKKRLSLLASQRTNQSAKSLDITPFFKGIKVQDFLQSDCHLEDDFHIIANPPFHPQNAPQSFPFTSGKTNSAALILDKCIRILPLNCRIATILPDVIRSGSRYEKFLKDVQSQLIYSKVVIEGKFSREVDVDVFILSGRKRSTKKTASKPQGGRLRTVQDSFKVSVGAVVPHRHKHEGEDFPYITAKDVKVGSTICSTSNSLRFTGTVFKAPFIALKRTSSPSDKNRICASIVTGNEFHTVENHILVIKPKDNTVKACLSLLTHLASPVCRDWIDKRIRCRHFTVTSIRNIPYQESHEH
jgi:hypothetical protein